MSQIEFIEPGPLRMHPAHRELPKPETDTEQWHAFVDSCSAAGPEGIPPILITPEGLICDGERRWKAARQLNWDRIAVLRRPESEAALIVVDSLMGQRHLTKGAKLYLVLPLLEEFVGSAESRRLANLRQGVKTIEKPLKVPMSTQLTSGEGLRDIAARFGASHELFYQAIRVRKVFAGSGNHKIEFQDGSTKTLKQHFEALILDSEHPMGLGEVLKGCGWFVDENGKPKKQAGPPDRNSHLHYFTHAWGNFSKQCERWGRMKPAERDQALAAIDQSARKFPAEVLEQLAEVHRDVRKSGKAEVGI